MRKTVLAVLLSAGISALTGCDIGGPKELLTVDFQEGRVLKYKMVSTRDVRIELTNSGEKNQSHEMTESIELLMEYTPVEVNPFGISKIQAKCLSAKSSRTALRKGQKAEKDSAADMQGKTYMLEISPIGQVEDFSEFTKLLQELGESSFVQSRQSMAVKNPDMLYDVMALQWNMWDLSSSIPKPSVGISLNKQWHAMQLLPVPLPVPLTRKTTYTLKEIIPEPQRTAVIENTFEFVDEEMENVPKIYDKKFNLKGSLFAVMRNFQVTSLEGSGRQVFNIDRGVLISDNQQWKMRIDASFMLPLGDSKPIILVDQKLSTELVD